MRLKDKVAVITGGSSGFGRAIAIAYAREGAKLVVGDLRAEPLSGGFEDSLATTTIDEIRRAGGTATFVRCDVTKRDDVRALVRAAVDTYGRLDIMFNNAGINRGGSSSTNSPTTNSTPAWT